MPTRPKHQHLIRRRRTSATPPYRAKPAASRIPAKCYPVRDARPWLTGAILVPRAKGRNKLSSEIAAIRMWDQIDISGHSLLLLCVPPDSLSQSPGLSALTVCPAHPHGDSPSDCERLRPRVRRDFVTPLGYFDALLPIPA